jgi:hypothetical protein
MGVKGSILLSSSCDVVVKKAAYIHSLCSSVARV